MNTLRTNSSKPSISFFCPAYNDEENLPILIPKTVRVLKKIASRFEIVIVEDGSPDKTASVADMLAKNFKPFIRVIHHKRNLGYGAALKRGFREASKYDYVFYTDGDNQYDVSEIRKFIPYLSSYDAVVGYRKNRSLTFRRKLQTIVFNFLVKALFRVKARDINNSLKIVRKSILSKLNLSSDSSFIEAEFFIKLNKIEAKIKEIPVRHYPRIHGKAAGGDPMVILKTIKDMLSFWLGYKEKRIENNASIFLLLSVMCFFAIVYILLPMPIQLIHITIPYLIDNGLVLYRDIVHHHTPLLWFFLYPFYSVLGFTFFTYRLYFLIVILLTIFFVYKSGYLFSKMAGIFATLFFAIFYFPFFSDSQLEEVTIAFFSSISLYFMLRFAKTKRDNNAFLSGIFLGCAIMVKQVVTLLVPIMIIYLLIKKIISKEKISYIMIGWFSFGVSLVIGTISLYFFSKSALYDFFYWNVLFNLKTYSKEAPVASISEGLKIAFIFTAFIYPLVIIYN